MASTGVAGAVVNGDGAANGAGALASQGGAQPAQSRSPTAPGLFPSDSTSTSNIGSQLQQLQELATRDPGEFQSVTSSIADRLQAASVTGSDSNASALQALAGSFRAAATSGHLPALNAIVTTPASGHAAVRKYAQSVSANGESDAWATLGSALAATLPAA